MDRWELFHLFVYPELVSLKNKYSASSVFIIGSFLHEEMWKLGLSDIDVVFLTDRDVLYKNEIDIANRCIDYLNKQGNPNIKAEEISIRLSYVIWNEEMFFRQDAWECYWEKNKVSESSIIEDQLLYSASNKLVIGEEKRNIRVDPTNYRLYLAARYNDVVLPDYQYITLLSEVKRIIYACRIFHFLWTGCYIYQLDKLLEEVTTTFNPDIFFILQQAVEAKEQLSNNLIDLVNLKNGYFFNTRKFHYLQKQAVKKILDLDKNYSSIVINDNFVKLYY